MNMYFPSLAHDGNEKSILDLSNYHDSNTLSMPLKKRAKSAPTTHGNPFFDENIEVPFASFDRNGFTSTNNPFDGFRGSQLLSHVYASSSCNESNFVTPSAKNRLLCLDLPPASFEPLAYTETPPLEAAPTNTRQLPLNYTDIHDIYQSLPLQERISQEINDQFSLVQPNPLTALSSHAAAKSMAPSKSKSEGSASKSASKASKRFKPFHEEKWNEHLEELRSFKKTYGHCLVPHTFPENQNLARWVKRQRRQYKLMLAGKTSSTMTHERVNILNKEDFIWDSHDIIWRERFNQLLEYKNVHGHTRVPSYCKENPR